MQSYTLKCDSLQNVQAGLDKASDDPNALYCLDVVAIPQAITASVVCIEMTEKAMPQYGYSLWEVEVYPPGQNSANVVAERRASASSFENESFTAHNAADRMYGFRWASLGTKETESWLAVCLTARQSISRLKLYWQNAYAAQYSVKVR